MTLMTRRLSQALVVLLGSLTLAVSIAAEERGRLWLADQGWRVVSQADGSRVIELNVLVLNDTQEPRQYEVRFVGESSARPPRAGAAGAGLQSAQPAERTWSLAAVQSVRGGPLAAGASEPVKATFPYQLLQRNQSYRFRAELVDRSDGHLVASTIITSSGSPFAEIAAPGRSEVLALGGVASGVALLDQALKGEGRGPVRAHGWGTMQGTHTARREGNEWVESGSGVIRLRTVPAGTMVLNYTYTARGPSAASLVANATTDPGKENRWVRADGRMSLVAVSSSSASIISPGSRQQTGQVITRTGCTATGTFSGTVDREAWHGALTMTRGTQTLNLASGTGTHSFTVAFTASR
jgi:hypothetical protein